MIIVCPECSTKFNVDSDRIPNKGAKVRCARCKHVFLVEKPLENEVPILEEVKLGQEDKTDSVEQQTPPIPAEDSFDETLDEKSDFSYDKFQELDSSTTGEESFSFGTAADTENENFFSENHEEVTVDNNVIEEAFTFSEAAEETVSTIEKVISTPGKEKVSPEPTVAEKVTDEAVNAAEDTAEPEFPAQSIPEKKGGPASSIIRILLLLILGILIIGGVFVYMNGTDQLNQTIQQIFGQQDNRPVQTGQITLGELEGKFIQNEQEGELFLIRGEAVNDFTKSRAGIQVRGVIFDQNGKPLLQKTVFCGNSIDDDKLLTLPFLELEKIMGNQFGHELSNMKIASKQSIPFAIVFKDLPKNLSEFSVKVTASKPATE